MRTRVWLTLILAALPLGADEKKEDDAPAPVDLKKVLSSSKEFQEKLKSFKMSYKEGVVRAVGEIVYRGGGPCEYLINVFPAKAHETVVLLDNGPWKGEGRRSRQFARGLALTLNNAFLCAGFKKGRAFSWNQKTGEVFPPKGETVHVYAEWQDEQGKKQLARMCEWLWNFKTIDVMKPGHFVYTGSMMIDEGPPNHKKWFGAEVDGLLVAIMNTGTALVDNTEEGSEENGAYEAIPARIPSIGTRVTVIFSKTPLPGARTHEPLKLPKEVLEARERRAAEKAAAAKKAPAQEPGAAKGADKDK